MPKVRFRMLGALLCGVLLVAGCEGASDDSEASASDDSEASASDETTGSVSSAIALPSACPAARTRREFRTLSAAEQLRFANALRTLNKGTRPTTLDRIVNINLTFHSQVLGTAMYLPFYRRYVRLMEDQLNSVDPTVTLPYWDSSLDASAPELAPVFTRTVLGVFKDVGTVANPAIGTWTVSYPSLHVVRRSFDKGTRISPFLSAEAMNYLVVSATTYEALRLSLEQASARVHNGIGGDMATMASPNDPIFWMHMANVDRLWTKWQRLYPAKANTFAGRLYNGATARPTSPIPYFGDPASRVIDVNWSCAD